MMQRISLPFMSAILRGDKVADDKKPETKKKIGVADLNDDPSLVDELSLEDAVALTHESGLAGDLPQRLFGKIAELKEDED